MNKGAFGFPKRGGSPRGWTVIDEVRIRSNGDVIYFRGIRQDFTHLQFLFTGRGNAAAGSLATYFRFNGDSGANYDRLSNSHDGVTNGVAFSEAQTQGEWGRCLGSTAGAGRPGWGNLLIPDYHSTYFQKVVDFRGAGYDPGGARFYHVGAGLWRSTYAIEQIELHANAIGTGWLIGTVATLLAI